MRRPKLRAWLERSAGASAVGSIEPMGGSSSASIFRCDLGAGFPDVVVKVYDKPALADEAEDLARREGWALGVAGVVELPTPELVAADPTGTEIGAPVVAMTALPGRPRARPEPDPEAWVEGLAEVVMVIDDAPVPAEDLPRYVAWDTGPLEVPRWADDPGPWREMGTILGEELPSAEWRFIHRDLHMLNVLWHGGTVSGVVDWPNACLGPIEADLARSRVNMAVVSDPADPLALADRFIAHCGVSYDTRWDLTVVAGFLSNDGEVLLNANDFGDGLTRDGIRAAMAGIVHAALS